MKISWNVAYKSYNTTKTGQRDRSCPVGRVLSSWPEGPGSRLALRKLPCTLMAPGACKIVVGAMSSKFPFEIIPLMGPKWGIHPFRDGSKLRWNVSGSSIGMKPRPSAIVHQRSSSPTLIPLNQPTWTAHYGTLIWLFYFVAVVIAREISQIVKV